LAAIVPVAQAALRGGGSFYRRVVKLNDAQ
jgi:hypothetical protein